MEINVIFQQFFFRSILQSVGYKPTIDHFSQCAHIRRKMHNKHVTLNFLSLFRHRVSLCIFAIIFERLIQTRSYFQRFWGRQRHIFRRKNKPSGQPHCWEKLTKLWLKRHRVTLGKAVICLKFCFKLSDTTTFVWNIF